MNALHRWFATPLGRAVLETECRLLTRRLAGLYARTVLQVGAYGAGERPALFGQARQWVADDWPGGPVDIVADGAEMPFASESMDVVLLVHQLEFTEARHDVLREAARVVAPEGHLIVVGFNPVSLWGLRRLAAGRVGGAPWRGRYLGRRRLEDWLRVLGLAIEARDGLIVRPPLTSAAAMHRLARVEHWGRHYARWVGGVHVTLARKRVAGTMPLAPVERPRLAVIPGGLAQARSRAALGRRDHTAALRVVTATTPSRDGARGEE